MVRLRARRLNDRAAAAAAGGAHAGGAAPADGSGTGTGGREHAVWELRRRTLSKIRTMSRSSSSSTLTSNGGEAHLQQQQQQRKHNNWSMLPWRRRAHSRAKSSNDEVASSSSSSSSSPCFSSCAGGDGAGEAGSGHANEVGHGAYSYPDSTAGVGHDRYSADALIDRPQEWESAAETVAAVGTRAMLQQIAEQRQELGFT